jgi:hypothetical protein
MAPGKYNASRFFTMPKAKAVTLDELRANLPPPTMSPEESLRRMEQFRALGRKIKRY